jgi:hypothetical protein
MTSSGCSASTETIPAAAPDVASRHHRVSIPPTRDTVVIVPDDAPLVDGTPDDVLDDVADAASIPPLRSRRGLSARAPLWPAARRAKGNAAVRDVVGFRFTGGRGSSVSGSSRFLTFTKPTFAVSLIFGVTARIQSKSLTPSC